MRERQNYWEIAFFSPIQIVENPETLRNTMMTTIKKQALSGFACGSVKWYDFYELTFSSI